MADKGLGGLAILFALGAAVAAFASKSTTTTPGEMPGTTPHPTGTTTIDIAPVTQPVVSPPAAPTTTASVPPVILNPGDLTPYGGILGPPPDQTAQTYYENKGVNSVGLSEAIAELTAARADLTNAENDWYAHQGYVNAYDYEQNAAKARINAAAERLTNAQNNYGALTGGVTGQTPDQVYPGYPF